MSRLQKVDICMSDDFLSFGIITSIFTLIIIVCLCLTGSVILISFNVDVSAQFCWSLVLFVTKYERKTDEKSCYESGKRFYLSLTNVYSSPDIFFLECQRQNNFRVSNQMMKIIPLQ